jgi:hypothetical protein
MRMNRFAWQDLIESSNFKLRQSIREQVGIQPQGVVPHKRSVQSGPPIGQPPLIPPRAGGADIPKPVPPYPPDSGFRWVNRGTRLAPIWEQIEINEQLQLQQAYESGRRQGLNEQGSPGRGLGKNLGVGSADISRPTTMMGDPAACPVGWGGCGTEGGPYPCAPGSDCAPCANGAEHCRSDRKAGAGCYFVWMWSGGGWNESLICADGPGGGAGGGFGGGK